MPRRSSHSRLHHEEEGHDAGQERWLVTYADMLTLLCVLFIVMYSMSQVDEQKYNALKSGLSNGFGQTNSSMQGSAAILDGSDASIQPNLVAGNADLSREERERLAHAIRQNEQLRRQAQVSEATTELKNLRAIERQIEEALRRKGLQDDVQTTIDERGLVVSLVSRHIVFPANLASLSPRGTSVVDALSPVLHDIDHQLRVDGHTNQVKVQPRYFATDWDLSSARAVTVLRRLNERGRIPQRRLSASAYGHERPLIDPELPRSQDINKRVDIVVLTQLAPESQPMLGNLAKAEGEA